MVGLAGIGIVLILGAGLLLLIPVKAKPAVIA